MRKSYTFLRFRSALLNQTVAVLRREQYQPNLPSMQSPAERLRLGQLAEKRRHATA